MTGLGESFPLLRKLPYNIKLNFGFVSLYKFLLDPTREDNHSDRQIGIVGDSTPEQGDERRGT